MKKCHESIAFSTPVEVASYIRKEHRRVKNARLSKTITDLVLDGKAAREGKK